MKNQRKNQKTRSIKKNQKPIGARPIRKKSKNKVVGTVGLEGRIDLGRPPVPPTVGET
jgi:hypothetical protein